MPVAVLPAQSPPILSISPRSFTPFPITSTASLFKCQQKVTQRKAEAAVAKFRAATVDAG